LDSRTGTAIKDAVHCRNFGALPASVVGRDGESRYVPMRGPQVGDQDLDMRWEAASRKLSGVSWSKSVDDV
jgi:hypothetical protein